jgi:ABC-type transport system involved in cytochrome c biogenesis ATPase subunit
MEYLFGRIDVNKKFHQLSYGQKRKMRMLLLLLINKPVWILDDPFNGLDDETISKLIKIISMKRDQHGMIIMASHIIPHIKNMKEFELS